MNDAGLDRGLRVDRLDRLREPFQPVNAADQDVLHTALLEVGQHLHPELRALIGLEPHPQHVTLTVHADRQRQIARLPLHAAAVADLQHQRVEEHDRVDVLQGPGLPGAGVLHHRVSHLGDQVPADLHAVDLLQVRLDIPRREPARVKGEDLVVEPLKAPLTLSDDLRLKHPRPIPGRLDPDRAALRDQRLRRRPVPGVPRPARRFLMGLIAKVVGQLDLHRPLHQPLRELAQQPTGPGDLLLRASARKQLVDQLIRQKRLDLLGELRPRRGWSAARSASASLRSPSGLASLHAGAIRPINGLSQTVCDCARHRSPFGSMPTQKVGHSPCTLTPAIRGGVSLLL